MGTMKDLIIGFEEEFGREPNAVEIYLYGELKSKKEVVPEKQEKKDPHKEVSRKRQRLHEIVNKYAMKNSIPFSYAWNDLYKECKWQLHLDFVKRAENKNVPTLDYIVGAGYLPIVLDIAKKELVDV